MVWHWHKNRQIDQQSRRESLYMNLYYNNQLILNKDDIKHIEEKDRHSINAAEKIGYLHVEA